MGKAQLGNLQGIVIALVVIGIVLGVSFYVLQEFQGTVEDKVSNRVYNETLTTVTDTGETVSKAVHPVFVMVNLTDGSANSVACVNSSNGAVVLSVNLTATTVGVISYVGDIADTTQFNNSDWNCSYSFTHASIETWTGVNQTITAVLKIPAWLTIIVIILIVGIIMAILFGVFPRFGAGAEGGKGLGRFSFSKGGGEGTAEI